MAPQTMPATAIVTVRPAVVVAATDAAASDQRVRAPTSAQPDRAQASVPVAPAVLVASATDHSVTAVAADHGGAAGRAVGGHAATFARPSCFC
jgi:hypothetical protein